MNVESDDSSRLLECFGEEGLETPGPSEALQRAVDSMKPVRTRRVLHLPLYIGLSSVFVSFMYLSVFGLRRDLAFLPTGWFFWFGTAWLLAFVVVMSAAVWPCSGWMQADARRALWASLSAVAALTGLALFWSQHAPGHSVLTPPGLVPFLRHAMPCWCIGTACAAVPAGAAVWLQRRAIAVRPGTIAAGVGTAAGAFGGLVLHFHCPIADSVHVTIAHAGVMVIAASLAASLARRLLSP